MDVRGMRTLIYKRTHSGDPDPASGVFGNADCMRSVRAWPFDAVIGIGGIGPEPIRNGIAGKLTWVGIGAHKTGDTLRPRVAFEHFLYFGDNGRSFTTLAPILAAHIYGRNVRTIMNSLSDKERAETERILRMALDAPASAALLRRANVALTKRRARRPAPGVSVTKATRSTKC